MQCGQAPRVTADAEVAVVATEHLAKTLVLYFDRPMPHLPALLIDRLERARKTVFRRELSHHRIAFQRGSPYMAEPEEIEGRGQRRVFTIVGSPLWSEINQSGLLRVEFQPELPQALSQHRQHALRVAFVGKKHH